MNRRFVRKTALAAAFVSALGFGLGTAPVARAGYGSVFGFGAESIALGGTSLVAGEASPFSAYTNPAMLGFLRRPALALGILSTDVDLKGFGRIVIDENGTFGSFNSAGVLGGRGQMIGLGLPFGKKSRPLTIGVVAYFSGDSVSRISSPPVNNPFYPVYQDVTRNAAYTVSAGYRVWRGLALGFAANTSLVSIADYRLVNSTTGADFSASAVEVKSAFSPSAAIAYDFAGDAEAGAGLPLVLGLMYRGKTELKTKFAVSAEIQNIPVVGDLTSYPHFSPAEWIFSGSYRLNPRTTLAFDLARVDWSEYKNPVGGGNINSFIFGSGSANAGFKDVWVPRVGAQHKFASRGFVKEYALRAGYFFYPTPVPDQTGNANFADSDRHGISAGAGFGIKNPWVGEEASLLHFDLFAQYNRLKERQVVKNLATNLGAPGYRVGGEIWVYGLMAKLEF